MKFDFANIKTKPFFKTILFYIVATLTIYILEKILPTGAHTPGLGLLALLVLPFICGVLFIINFIKCYQRQKEFLFSAIFHFVFIIGFIIYFKII